MKKIMLYFIALALSACSSLENISTNTQKANDHLLGIQANSSIPAFIKDSADIFLSRAKYEDIYSANVIWDTSYAISVDWFRFNVHTRPNTDEPVIFKYTGFVNAATPSILYITGIKQDIIPVKPDALRTVEVETLDKAITDRRLLNLNESDWQKIIVGGIAVFDGFEIKNRNFNYLDLSRYSFNYAYLNTDTFYKVTAMSPDKLETSSNSYRYLKLNQAVMVSSSFKNWHFVTDDLTNINYWTNNTLNSVEFNDVVMRKMGISDSRFNNCIFRNTNYGSFKNIVFTKTNFSTVWMENAFFDESEFYGCNFTGHIFTSRFVSTKFGRYDLAPVTPTVFLNMPRVQGKFTNCLFNAGVQFNNSHILESEFTGGTLNGTEFINNASIKNSFFKDVVFRDVKFGNTEFASVQFGDAAATTKMLMTGCDFLNVVWKPNVIFNNVDFLGSRFPPRSVLNNLGVQFNNCRNEPVL